MKRLALRRPTAFLSVIAGLLMAAALLMPAATAQASGITDHTASLGHISATVGFNSWSTPSYPVSQFTEDEVGVSSLGGTCVFCYWYSELRSGDGSHLWTSPATYSATEQVSVVRDWSGRVYSEIVVAPWTSASGVSFDTLTCC
jgi:hypothetical protein